MNQDRYADIAWRESISQAQPSQSWLAPSTCRHVSRRPASAAPLWLALGAISSALFIVCTAC